MGEDGVRFVYIEGEKCSDMRFPISDNGPIWGEGESSISVIVSLKNPVVAIG